MYIAYSALSTTENKNQDTDLEPEMQLRYQAYRDACNKHSNHIAVIQQYLPGWVPSPPAP